MTTSEQKAAHSVADTASEKENPSRPPRELDPAERLSVLLPFISLRKKGDPKDKVHSYWLINETGDYALDWILGGALASRTIEYLQTYYDPLTDAGFNDEHLFSHIVADMIKVGRVGGIELELGFIRELGKRAAGQLRSGPGITRP